MDRTYTPLALRDISAQNVAKYIVDGTYQNIDRRLPPQESDIVFGIVNIKRLRLPDQERERADSIINRILQPSVMHFNRYTTYASNFRLARNHDLERFGIGILREPTSESAAEFLVQQPPKRPKLSIEQPVDIIELLRENLTLNTQQSLEELDLSNYYQSSRSVHFVEGWILSLAQHFPSLKSLKVASTNIGYVEFNSICANFRHLNTLDLSDALLFNLDGISNLQLLENLALRSTVLSDEAMNELYGLQNLKTFILSGTTRRSSIWQTLRSFIDSNKTLPALQEFDCSQTEINNRDIKKIEKRHPTLKRIIATGTHINGYSSDISNLKVYTDESFPACLHSLSFYEERCHYVRIRYVLEKMIDLLKEAPAEQVKEEQLKRVNKELHLMIPKFGDYSDILYYIERCCHHLSQDGHIRHFNNDDKRILIESFLRLLEVKKSNWPYEELNSLTWSFMERVLEMTENPQVERIVAVAIYFFLKFPEGSKCYHTITWLLQQQCYKDNDKEKRISEIEKYQKKFPEKKEEAEFLIYFFKTLNK
ncbi:hypothetical protein CAEBREN_16099 [Caenorhabditis brenneri]|uniref:Uncharacterized protein n=1 Tax=Caenorhabditis brenneri TaxID=135651 RepID=G0N511_CAEBE|nr:hypothetical protein CAEBREN_16099 [Caenorhabditis brenneri]